LFFFIIFAIIDNNYQENGCFCVEMQNTT